MSTSPLGRVIAARIAIVLMVIVPAIGFIAGLAAKPGPARDPIAVSTVFLLFFGLPGCTVLAALAFWLIPRRRPLLRRLVVATCFSLAAILCVADFWFIGIGAGLKSRWLKLYFVPVTVLVALTACQWPRTETPATKPATPKQNE
jgi:glucan phosphoethanolaminetransferase (alkaline phosphatase superfamily)